MLGIKNPADAFLLSPVEMRDLVDRVGSPWVQVCLDTAAVQRHGFPADWVETLGRRIVNVHATDRRQSDACLPGDGEVDWPAVAGALHRTGYTGPLVCMNAGDLNEMARRLDQILAHS